MFIIKKSCLLFRSFVSLYKSHGTGQVHFCSSLGDFNSVLFHVHVGCGGYLAYMSVVDLHKQFLLTCNVVVV